MASTFEPNYSRLTRAAIKTLVSKATTAYKLQGQHAALLALQPLVDDVARCIAMTLGNPFDEFEAWFNQANALIAAWPKAINEWRADNFAGPMPGQRAVAMVARDMLKDADPFLQDGREVKYRDADPLHFVASISGQVFGRDRGAFDTLCEAIEAETHIAMIDAASKTTIPQNLFAECVWVPGWDGKSLDDAIERFGLTVSTMSEMPSVAVQANDALIHLLNWTNVSPSALKQAVKRAHGNGSRLNFVHELDKLEGKVVPSGDRRQLFSPDDLVSIIDNGYYRCALPVVYAEINVRALFALDPREPMLLGLDSGKGFAAGLHDFVNGAGYVDIWPGSVVIEPMSVGVISADRYRYGIDGVYGVVRSAFRCTPKAPAPVAQAA